MLGVYLAVNAVTDAFLLVDGPDCAHMKTQYVQGNHDWLSTLTDINGFHRISNTALHPFHMARSREPQIQARLATLASHEPAGVVMVTPLPMASITAVDYERLGRQVAQQPGTCPVLSIPNRSLAGDWLTGYSLTLQSLAAQMKLKPGTSHPGRVGLVGYLMDRNEGDHQANLTELRRLLGALDVDLLPPWLSGSSYADLQRIGEASMIVSLPYGRRAARTLARRLQVPLVETDLPFGLAGTARWLRQVATALERQDRVEEVIDSELSRVVPPLEWVIPHLFLHRRLSFVGDPYLLAGFHELIGELGCRPGPCVVTARSAHGSELKQLDGQVIFEPQRQLLMAHLEPAHRGMIDLVVANNLGISVVGDAVATVEFGFPSFSTHALYPRPFLGFDGALAFIDTMANALRQADFTRQQRHYVPSTQRTPQP
jgi:nitrogenase molybdenum-iron protein alpha/beta subunit